VESVQVDGQWIELGAAYTLFARGTPYRMDEGRGDLRILAKHFLAYTDLEIATALKQGELTEIVCNE
jgi:hypothetical protein